MQKHSKHYIFQHMAGDTHMRKPFMCAENLHIFVMQLPRMKVYAADAAS